MLQSEELMESGDGEESGAGNGYRFDEFHGDSPVCPSISREGNHEDSRDRGVSSTEIWTK